MKKLEVIFNIVFSFCAFILGGIDALFNSLLIVIALDFITGIAKSIYMKKYKNIFSLKQILKKFGYILIIALATIIDQLLGDNSLAIRTIVIYFFIANDAISILENWSSVGLPIPKKLKQVVEQLTSDND